KHACHGSPECLQSPDKESVSPRRLRRQSPFRPLVAPGPATERQRGPGCVSARAFEPRLVGPTLARVVGSSRGSFRGRDGVGQALGNVLPIAVAVAIFPVPIIAVVLLLGSERGTTKAGAFVLTSCAGLAAIGAVVLVLAGIVDARSGGKPATWVNVLLLVLGLLLLALAVKQWRGRPRGDEETPMPGWMRTMDDFTIVKAG